MEALQPGERVRLLPSDQTILDAREQRADVGCEVKPVTPQLGYELGFDTGYEVTVPIRQLAGTGNTITAIFRVVPDDALEEPAYFSQKWTVPPLEEDAKGSAVLRGNFVVGEGNYHVDWLLRDQDERFCSAFWQISAARRGKDRPVTLWVEPGEIRPANRLFAKETPIKREPDHPIRLLVFFHVAPESTGAAALESNETAALAAILRSIAREPRVESYSIAAFNLEQDRVLYREHDAPMIDLPALGRAIEQLPLGTVSIERLRDKERSARFMAELVTEEMAASRPEAVIFVGSKGGVDDGAVRGSLKSLKGPGCPVFYLNYSAGIQPAAWGDAIGGLVKLWSGSEYTINKPRDVVLAWRQVMAKLSINDGTERSGQVTALWNQP